MDPTEIVSESLCLRIECDLGQLRGLIDAAVLKSESVLDICVRGRRL